MRTSIIALSTLTSLLIGANASIEAGVTRPSHTYKITYFSTNHDYLTFHMGTQKFYSDTTGSLSIHVGDTVDFAPDATSATPIDVRHVDVVDSFNGIKSGHSSGPGIVNKYTTKEIEFTAITPGAVTLTFRRAHSTRDGKFVVHVARRPESMVLRGKSGD